MRIKTDAIKVDLGIEPDGRVQRFLVDTCANHMDKYIPQRDGLLRENILKTSHSIIYKQPYAHAQYIGYTKGPVRNYTTPGTGPYWDERMKSAEIEQVIAEVQEFMNRG